MFMNDPNIDEKKGYIYLKWEFMKDTWCIQFGNVYSYVLIGEEKALVIDTAYGVGDLRKFIEEQITTKPVIVANTHGHFDHTGGNAFWEDAYMSEISTQDCKRVMGPEAEKAFLAMPHPDYATHVLKEGDVIDLGGRKVEVIEIGAHHDGSLAYLDHSNRCLYTGDELESGQVIIFRGTRKEIEKHLANMKKLQGRKAEFDFICPAHNGTPIVPEYIDDFVKLDEGILDGTAKVMPHTAGNGMQPDFGFGRGVATRVQYGRASICHFGVKDE